MIDPGIHRDMIRTHLAACEPCAALLTFAPEHGDLEALGAWRLQLALHLRSNQARREFDASVLRVLHTV